MAEVSVAEFLHRSVYPRLDAVEAGLFSNLKPKKRSTSGSYTLVCPACKELEGYYFPGTGFIHCPRENECGVKTSLWDALLFCDYSHSEIFPLLCSAAGVERPRRDGQGGGDTAKPVKRIGKAIVEITQALARKYPEPLLAFQQDRGYTDQQMQTMGFGYYSSAAEVMAMLRTAGFSVDDAAAVGYVEVSADRPGDMWSSMAERIVGYWPHADGEVRLWGRIPTGSGDKANPKYRFSPSLKKNEPYLFRSRKPTVLVNVEGTLDAWAMQLQEIWGTAIGGASIIPAQAAFLAQHGVTECAHMVDGDKAGWVGAIPSIRNLESVGIVSSIIPLGAGMDDPDSLVRAGRGQELHAMVQGRINGGLYLALMLRSEFAASAPDLALVNKVFAAAKALTPVSRAIFDKHAALLGLRHDLEYEAARVLGASIQLGLPLEDALRIVRQRTGLAITFTPDEESQ